MSSTDSSGNSTTTITTPTQADLREQLKALLVSGVINVESEQGKAILALLNASGANITQETQAILAQATTASATISQQGQALLTQANTTAQNVNSAVQNVNQETQALLTQLNATGTNLSDQGRALIADLVRASNSIPAPLIAELKNASSSINTALAIIQPATKVTSPISNTLSNPISWIFILFFAVMIGIVLFALTYVFTLYGNTGIYICLSLLLMNVLFSLYKLYSISEEITTSSYSFLKYLINYFPILFYMSNFLASMLVGAIVNRGIKPSQSQVQNLSVGQAATQVAQVGGKLLRRFLNRK